MSVAVSFSFQHAFLSTLVEVRGDVLIGKTSTRTSVVPLNALRAFYAPRAPRAAHRELVLAYEEGGRLRRARLFADAGDAGFEGLVGFLRARAPELDISRLPAREAYEALGCRDAPWVAVPLVMLGATLLLAALASPLLLHGVDRGAARLAGAALGEDAAALGALLRALPSRNLTLDNAALDVTRAALLEEAGRVSLLAPIVPLDAAARPRPDAPVVALGLWSGRRLDLEALGARRALRGVWRGVGWEGLSAPQRARLKDAGIVPAEPHLLLELDANPAGDLLVYVSLVGFSFALTALVWGALRARRPLHPQALEPQAPHPKRPPLTP